jgi:hypothetical protein
MTKTLANLKRALLPLQSTLIDDMESTLDFQSAVEEQSQEEFHSVEETFGDQGHEQQPDQGGVEDMGK